MIAHHARHPYGLCVPPTPTPTGLERPIHQPCLVLPGSAWSLPSQIRSFPIVRLDTVSCRGGGQDFERPSLTMAVGVASSPSAFRTFIGRRKSRADEVVLDLRSKPDFDVEHLVGSTSMPVDELRPRLLELPPPFDDSVSIVGGDEVGEGSAVCCVGHIASKSGLASPAWPRAPR